MRVDVVIATKGRAREVQTLIEGLGSQTKPPETIVVVGSCSDDLPGAPLGAEPVSTVVKLISSTPGSCIQRNVGIDYIVDAYGLGGIIVFFDDDYRPARDWISNVERYFEASDCVGLTGQVLADGVRVSGITEAQADALLSSRTRMHPHWASGELVRPVGSVYGCNMAFRASIFSALRFDENLPLYGWQEDRDLTAAAKRIGPVVYFPDALGVHLGVKSGRVSGLRFGYSQIANPLYLYTKGTMNLYTAMNFAGKAIIANIVKSVFTVPEVDHRGRLRGSLTAVKDIILGRCHPLRVINLI